MLQGVVKQFIRNFVACAFCDVSAVYCVVVFIFFIIIDYKILLSLLLLAILILVKDLLVVLILSCYVHLFQAKILINRVRGKGHFSIRSYMHYYFNILHHKIEQRYVLTTFCFLGSGLD